MKTINELMDEIARLRVENERLARAQSDSESRFTLFMEAIPNACILLDGELRFIHMNRSAETLSCRSLDSVKGQSISTIPEDSNESRSESLLEVLRTGKALVVDDIALGGIFGLRRFCVRAFKVGDCLGVIWTDISAEKSIEAKYVAAQAELRSLAAHLLQVREDERKHIAREIHDELGQSLTAIDMELRWMAHKHEHALPEIRARIEAILAQSAGAIESVGRIASELRPGILDHLGLRAAIEWFAGDFSRRTMIAASAEIDINESLIDEKTATAIFRITQESMTNAARHASAGSVSIALREEGGAIALEIRDDGVGISEEQASGPSAFGILGMRERVKELGGRLEIHGAPGLGTRIAVYIPLHQAGKLP